MAGVTRVGVLNAAAAAAQHTGEGARGLVVCLQVKRVVPRPGAPASPTYASCRPGARLAAAARVPPAHCARMGDIQALSPPTAPGPPRTSLCCSLVAGGCWRAHNHCSTWGRQPPCWRDCSITTAVAHQVPLRLRRPPTARQKSPQQLRPAATGLQRQAQSPKPPERSGGDRARIAAAAVVFAATTAATAHGAAGLAHAARHHPPCQWLPHQTTAAGNAARTLRGCCSCCC